MVDGEVVTSDKNLDEEKRNRNFKSIAIAAGVSAFIGSIIGVFFILDEKPNILYFLGEFIKNFDLSIFLMMFTYLFVIRKKLPPDTGHSQHWNSKPKQFDDPMHPAYGVNNPASPFCHHRNSFSERNRNS